MNRINLKLCGESGTGLVSTGEIISKSLKKSGYHVFTTREFPSLIKGGRANYQISFSSDFIRSPSKNFDLSIAFDVAGLQESLETLKQGGLLIHGFERIGKLRGFEKEAQAKKIVILSLLSRQIAMEEGGSSIMANMVILGLFWKVLDLDLKILEQEVGKVFASKPKLLEIDLRCLRRGYQEGCRQDCQEEYQENPQKDSQKSHQKNLQENLQEDCQEAKNLNLDLKLASKQGLKSEPKLDSSLDLSLKDRIKAFKKTDLTKNILLDGNTALAIGAIHCGVRAYFAYPMSPASSILSYFSKTQNQTGIVVKQAEDEITAVQMTLGASFMGTRSLTATSGGGYDLMTETVSLAGMIETPLVVVIAQRPGPATGVPTWTAQADLDLAIYSGHGEYAKIVMSVSDVEDCFLNIQIAFNLAEKYQVPVILLTEKAIAESKQSVAKFTQKSIPIERGMVNFEPQAQQKLANLKRSDRYQPTPNGLSKRWLPNTSKATYFANGDEHGPEGTLDESPEVAKMIDKRNKKLKLIQENLPEPEIFEFEAQSYSQKTLKKGLKKTLIVGWGSTKNAVLDAGKILANRGISLTYIHYTYLYPLKTQKIQDLAKSFSKIILLEGNYQGQLGRHLESQGISFTQKQLKYNGRNFFVEDVLDIFEQ
jgi:2-oxoglutarate ferredoxin oxidoreductase subunit alpha